MVCTISSLIAPLAVESKAAALPICSRRHPIQAVIEVA